MNIYVSKFEQFGDCSRHHQFVRRMSSKGQIIINNKLIFLARFYGLIATPLSFRDNDSGVLSTSRVDSLMINYKKGRYGDRWEEIENP